MRVYLYSKCSTCKDALRFLNDRKIKIEIREITTTPPSLDELNAMLHYQNGQLKNLFNTSGNLYREMQLADQLDNMPLQKALELLTTHGMLVKRPFLLGKNFGLLGFNKAEWSKLK
jgi:arsenate reductase (glutaredoxin)